MRRSMSAAALCLLSLGTAAVHADSTTPKGAATDFMLALANGDAAEAKKHAIFSTEEFGRAVDAMARLFSAQGKFQTAVSKAFPNEPGANLKTSSPEQMRAQIEAAMLKETGDTATLSTAESKSPMALRKVNGEWKVDVESMPELKKMVEAGAQLGAMASAMETTATEVDAGQYKTFVETNNALRQRMMAAMQDGPTMVAPSTQPNH